MRDAFSDRKLLRTLIKIFYPTPKNLRLGSATLFGCGATHIVVSRKLVTRCAHAPPDPSLSLLRWSYSYIGLFLTLFFIFSFFEQCILFFIQWLFFYFLKIFKTNRKLLFFDFIKFQKLPCWFFFERHARHFVWGRRQFVASSSFNPFPLDRLLGRPTPPWVP